MPGTTDFRTQSSQKQQVQELASHLERAWCRATGSTQTVDLSEHLPGPGDPLRPLALRELIKTDLEIRWRRGLPVTLEYYLCRFPELGTLQALPTELILEEYQVRQRYGDRPSTTVYRERFPDQYEQLLPMIQVQSMSAQPVPETLASGLRPGATPSSASNTPPASPPPSASELKVLPAGTGYRMLKRLGAGAYGEVWRAEAPGGTEVAIKVITRPIDHHTAQQELKALEQVKRLRHPYLVQTQAYWVLEDRLYIVMDLADGSLHDRANQCQAEGLPGVPLEELLRYFQEAAEALDYLHSEQIHHRDIKPANILLLKGHAKVADFGLARLLQAGNTVTEGTCCGTPAFMAPEVWNGKVSPHSDQWSLAVTYAELRLNRRLFASPVLAALMYEICQGDPDLSPLEEAEQQVLRKALARDPRERYPSCKDFVLALRAALLQPSLTTHSGVVASRSKVSKGPPRKGRRWGWIAALAACLVLVGLGAVFFWLRSRAPSSAEGITPAVVRLDDPTPVTAATGTEATFTVPVHRENFAGPIKVSVAEADVPPHVSIQAATAGAGEDRVAVRVAVAPEATPGTYKVRLRTAEGVPPAEAVLVLRVLFLPPQFEPVGDATVADGRGVLYYQRIVRRLDDGKRVLFVLVPWKGEKEHQGRKAEPGTFYISQDKITVGQFRVFAAQQPGKVISDGWKGSGSGDQLPVLGVTVEEAYAFASWLKGNLPTLEQWDKAAGLSEQPRGEGPYRGSWEAARKPDVAVNLQGPRPVGASTADVSPFGCRDMAGNGYEWTRTLTLGKGFVPVRHPGAGLLDYSVHLRGQSFTEDRPLTYADMEDEAVFPSESYNRTQSNIGFRVVIEP